MKTAKTTPASKTATARALRALPAKTQEQAAADRADVVAENLEADARALRGRGLATDAAELDAKAAKIRKPAKKSSAPKLDKSVAQETPADELPTIELDTDVVDGAELPGVATNPEDELVVCGTDTADSEEPGEPVPAPESDESDELDADFAKAEAAGIVWQNPNDADAPAAGESAFAAAFGAAETVRAATAAAKVAKAKGPRTERVKPAGELPFGNAHGAKATRLAAVWADMLATGTAPAAATPHELVQAVVSHNSAPGAGWTRGAVTTHVRRYLAGFAYSAIQSAANGVGIEIFKADGQVSPRDGKPAEKPGSVDPVELFRAHLAGLDAAAARLLLAELAAPFVASMPAPARDESIGRELEID